MFVIRPPREGDIAAIVEVARHLDSVNLPASESHIRTIVELAEKSFSEELPTEDREFLMVLEDRDSGRVVGTSMIHAQHGKRRSPHVYFQVLKDERYSHTIDHYFRHECLRLAYDYDGPTELGGLILLPELRGNGQRLGTLLSYVRFLYIAMHRGWFQDEILCELMPPLESDGTSKLWKHLGRRFTGLTYQKADLLSKDNKEFISALFPHSLIYTALFPDEVRDVIGEVGADTRGVKKILERIGFRYANQIDPFDGGPHFKAATDDITLIENSAQGKTRLIESADGSRPWAILATEEPELRALGCRVVLGPEPGTIGITEATHRALGVNEGDQIWYVLP
ncbi:MAG: arginine N-succinyltransferase [Deltaproteobacteria bacterium]|jgi:arginine N-succinyltransferase|nr:arginine N-succinyltransferase [Deltaproteobacteria bacterium]